MKKLVYPDDLDVLAEVILGHIDRRTLVAMALEEGVSLQDAKDAVLKDTRASLYKEWAASGNAGVERFYTERLLDELSCGRDGGKR